MIKTKKPLLWTILLISIALIALMIIALPNILNRPQSLLNDSVPLHDSITYLRVLHGQEFGNDVTDDINVDELLSLLAETQMWRDNHAWPGTWNAEWVIELSQEGNQFHRSIIIALGETHGMITERGFSLYSFRLSNGNEIIKALERMVFE